MYSCVINHYALTLINNVALNIEVKGVITISR